jgi:hypothetical protein
MKSNRSNNNSTSQNRTINVSSPRPIGIAPGRNIRSGERPSYQAPTPPKPK